MTVNKKIKEDGSERAHRLAIEEAMAYNASQAKRKTIKESK